MSKRRRRSTKSASSARAASRWPLAGATDDLAVHDIAGANIDGVEFRTRFDGLDQTARDKILGVASRLKLVYSLEREGAYSDNWNRIQVEALKVYLLCTCLDALTGQSKYLQFHEWVEREEQDEPLREALAEADSPTTPFLGAYRRATQILAQQWLNVHGVSRNFRRFISELPEPICQELINSYAIVKEPKESRSDWSMMKVETRLQRVAKYLYELRRNTFTHQAKIVPTIRPAAGISGWVCAIPQDTWEFTVYFTNANDIRGEVSLLRLVITGAIRSLMGYPVDQAFVELHWRVERAKQVVWLALRELDYNDRLRCVFLERWPVNLAEAPQYMRPKRLAGKALHKLAQGRDVDFSWFHPFTGKDDRDIRHDVSSYLAEIDRINKLIDRFEALALRPRVWDKTKISAYEKIRNAMRDGQWTQMAEAIAGALYFALEGAPETVELKRVCVRAQDIGNRKGSRHRKQDSLN